MSTLQSLHSYYDTGTWVTQLGVYCFATTDGSLSYLHLKTNVPVTGGRNTMWMIEFVGYAYGGAQNIRSAITFHTSVGTLYHVGTQNAYPGLTPQTVYISSDGYAVIRVTAPFYYTGFVINAYSTAPYSPNEPFRILSASQNNNSGTGTF
jgi:hypothetical protein